MDPETDKSSESLNQWKEDNKSKNPTTQASHSTWICIMMKLLKPTQSKILLIPWNVAENKFKFSQGASKNPKFEPERSARYCNLTNPSSKSLIVLKN